MLRVSLGGFFELYDLFMTAYLALGMIREGIFSATSASAFAIGGFASFVAAGFAGMWLGTLLVAHLADRIGRRGAFTVSLLWYSVATAVMAFMHTAGAIDLWRLLAGIGIGVQIVTIDAYVSEIAPREERGYWIAFSQFVGYLAIPCAALLAYLLVPHAFLGLAGWRYVALAGALGAVAVWPIRSAIPESRRWLEREGKTGIAELFRRPYGRRTGMLIVFNLAQTVGFYGFTSWVPILVAQQGVGFVRSLLYTLIMAAINPLGPIIAMRFADRWERKWQVAGLALAIAVAGLVFSQMRIPVWIVAVGTVVTLANAWFSSAFHAYQAELYPTRIRAGAVGFVYSFSRLSSVFVGFLIAWLLRSAGTLGVFSAIAAAMAVAAASVALFGDATNNRELEELAT